MAKSIYQIIVELQGDQSTKASLNDIKNTAAVAGTALTALSAAAAKSAADMESALVKLGTVSNQVLDDQEGFKDGIEDLSNELKNSASQVELTQASYDIASAGYQEQSEILAILEQSQKTATGGYSDLNTVANASTTILNALEGSFDETATTQERMVSITDQMLTVQNNGKIEAGQYAAQIGRVASTAGSAGVSLESLNAFIATSTSRGVSAEQSFTALQATISNIQKPTKEASDEAARLGIEFNATALKTKGLEGVLNSISSSTKLSDDSLTKLFGSMEAVKGVSAVTGENLSVFNSNLADMQEAAQGASGAVDKAFGAETETTAAKAAAAMNKISDAMVSIGEGAAIALAPAVEAVGFLVGAFNSLPAPIQQGTGLIIALTGGALTLGAALVTLIGFVNSGIASISTLTAALAAQAAAQATATGATSAAIPATVGLNAALLPLVATVGAVTAAVVALGVAWVHYNNIQIEQKNQALLDDLKDTQSLANAATRLGEQMKRTGEALPDAQFQQLSAALKEGANETNGLGQQLSTLEKFQQQAKDGTLLQEQAQVNANAATKDGTTATSAHASAVQKDTLSEEERAAKVKEFVEVTETAIQATQARFDATIASAEAAAIAEGQSEEQLLATMIQARTEFNQEVLKLRAEQLDSSLLSDEKRAAVEAERARVTLEQAKQLADGLERIQKLSSDRQIDTLRTQLAREKSIRANGGDGDVIGVERQITAAKIQELDRRIQAATKGSAEEASLQRQRAEEQLSLDQKVASEKKRVESEVAAAQRKEETARKREIAAEKKLRSDADKARKKAIADTKKAALEAEKARQAALKNTLGLLKAKNDADAGAVQLLKDQLGVSQSLNSGTQSFLSGSSSLLGDISASLRDQNVSEEQKVKLKQASVSLTKTLKGLGVQINGDLATEEGLKKAQAGISQAQVAFELQSLNLKRQEITLEAQLQKLKVQGQIAEAKIKLQSGTLTEAETKQARLQISLGEKRLGILEKQESVNKRNLDLQKKLVQARGQVTAATTGVGVPDVPDADSSGTSSGSTPEPSEADKNIDASIKKLTEEITSSNAEIIASSGQSASTLGELKSILDAQSSSLSDSRGFLESADATLSELYTESVNLFNQGTASLANEGDIINSLAFTNDLLQGVRSDLNDLINANNTSANNLGNAINNLPRNIAAFIPRPTSR